MKSLLRYPIIIFTFFCSYPAFAAGTFEQWECEAENGGLPQSLELTFENNILSAFDYSSSTPSPDRETFFSCSFSAKRNKTDSKWTDKPGKIKVKFNDSAEKSDRAIITNEKDTYTIEFQMSPSNCGHSTPYASKIAITKNNKTCHSIETDS